VAEGEFRDKVALVTGGSSGIGRAAALAFARAGANVVIASRGVEAGEAVAREIESASEAKAHFVRTDVADAGQVEALVHAAVARFGRLDCAFNNAASMEAGTFKPTAELSAEEFDRNIALNLRSVFLCLKHEITQLLLQGEGGAIVNTSSVNGLGGVARDAPYAAAKAGVLALTKSAAQEYATHGIRVNALVAGAFRTPMLERTFAQASPLDPSAAESAFAGLVPLRRIGRPDEAAETVLWLCSDRASYVTGHSMIVDGGFTSFAR
jgi:NAD(P)-dependent dehydrogenase (short-subunit alcohol dehydrogenase family)